uniref:hypothetical protein n=1 Tax=Acidisoma sp. S159 TaxID=1747225 RepID=UPI001C20B2C1
MEVLAAYWSAPLKCISGIQPLASGCQCDNHVALSFDPSESAYNGLRTKSSSNLTSNQVGLPAELKHINKRRSVR